MKKRRIIGAILILLLVGCKTKTYTVTFMDNGKLLKNVEIKKGETISNLEKPQKAGYLFVTWLKDGTEYDSSAKIESNLTLTASWVSEPLPINNHTVTFNCGSEIKTQTIADGEKAKKPEKDPQKEKYIFLGWYVGDTLYDFDVPVTKDIVLLAKFKKDVVILTYDLDGGVGQEQVEIVRGTIPEKPASPVKSGYDFLTWTLDGQPYNFDFPINSDVTIKAVYTTVEYVMVTFDTDGGNTLQEQQVIKGKEVEKLPVPMKEGYVFKSWTYNGQEFNVNTKIEEDITLLAIYEEVA